MAWNEQHIRCRRARPHSRLDLCKTMANGHLQGLLRPARRNRRFLGDKLRNLCMPNHITSWSRHASAVRIADLSFSHALSWCAVVFEKPFQPTHGLVIPWCFAERLMNSDFPLKQDGLEVPRGCFAPSERMHSLTSVWSRTHHWPGMGTPSVLGGGLILRDFASSWDCSFASPAFVASRAR